MNILSFQETERILSKYKIPFCKTEIFNSKEKAFLFAQKIGFPVALKVHGQKVFHKSEIGGVKINIDENNFELAWEEIMNNVEGKTIEGILVQEMVYGNEVAIGMNRDDQFGPTIMFGLGGIFIEIIKDVSLRVAPINKDEALEMIKELKGFEILNGARGGVRVNIDSIVDMLVKISNLSLKEDQIKSIDFNPVIVNKHKALIADFRIIV